MPSQIFRESNKLRDLFAAMIVLTLVVVLFILVSIISNSNAPADSTAFVTATVETDPIAVGYFYKPPQDGTSATTMAQRANFIILTRKDEEFVQELRQAGYTGDIVQYLMAEVAHGPSYLEDDSRACSTEEKQFNPYNNQVALNTGDFCEFHDSIVNGTAFDHDLDPVTSNIVATENWFLHNSSGQRIGNYGGGGFRYHMNHGNTHWQEYFISRAIREMEGSPDHTPTGMHGIFLDNLELSMEKKTNRLDVKGQPVEYATEAGFQTAVHTFAHRFYQELSSRGYPVWANMIENPGTPDAWDPYLDSLDGVMEESFALDWNGGQASMSSYERELTQSATWINSGKKVLLVSQGDNNNHQARYGLASFLLVTDGVNGYYRHADSSYYNHFYWYPDYQLQLGSPLGVAQQTTVGGDTVWTREFTCGSVVVNFTQFDANIQTTECGSPIPDPDPTPDPGPDPVPTSSTNVKSIADAYVAQNSPTSNYGSDVTIEIDGDPVKLTFIKFDLSSVSNTNLIGATLHLEVTNSSNSTQNIKLLSTNSWNEDNITYNNRPTTGELITTTNGNSAGTWTNIDVTSLVTQYSGQVISLLIESTGSDGLDINSREAGTEHAPEILVSYSGDDAPPSPDPEPVPAPEPLSSLSIKSSDDAYVKSKSPTRNYGSATTMKVDGRPVSYSYIKFDLSNVSLSEIASATLHMKVTNSSRSTQNIGLLSTNAWGEDTITYNNRPTESTFIASTSDNRSGEWTDIDITSVVTQHQGQTVSFLIESTGGDGLDLNTKESGITSAPEILIEY